MVLFSLFLSEVPNAYTAFSGRLASAAQVMSLLVIVFPSFPVVPVVVLKKISPPAVAVVDPFNVQY